MVQDLSPELLRQFETGSVRSSDRDGVAYHLISPIALERLAATCREGEKRYSAFNWEKGQPISEILNHAIAHLYDYLRGDRSEDHLAHAMWNCHAAIHSEVMWPHLNNDLRTEGCKPPCDSPSPAATGD